MDLLATNLIIISSNLIFKKSIDINFSNFLLESIFSHKFVRIHKADTITD